MNNIQYIQPYAIDKNIGRSYNEDISQLKDGWICITDHDCMFLRHDSKRQIQEIADKNEFDLYGCLTNRLAGIHQAPFLELFNESNISVHLNKANELHEFKYGICKPTRSPIAGMFMLFKKETWVKVGGFVENSIIFDKVFSGKIEKKAIMQGVYIFHLYRFGELNPKGYKSHLLNK